MYRNNAFIQSQPENDHSPKRSQRQANKTTLACHMIVLHGSKPRLTLHCTCSFISPATRCGTRVHLLNLKLLRVHRVNARSNEGSQKRPRSRHSSSWLYISRSTEATDQRTYRTIMEQIEMDMSHRLRTQTTDRFGSKATPQKTLQTGAHWNLPFLYTTPRFHRTRLQENMPRSTFRIRVRERNS